MNILVADTDTYRLLGFDNSNSAKEDIKNRIIQYSSEISLDCSKIRNIIIADLKNCNARVEKTISDNELCFDIFIQIYIIWYLYDKEKNKESYAKSVIFHELYHCIDLLNMPVQLIYNRQSMPITYNDLCCDLGYMQWSEYYAHYNSSKIEHSDIPTLKTDYESLFSIISTFNKLSNDITNVSYIGTYNIFLLPFYDKLIILLSNYNSIHSTSALEELKKYEAIGLEKYIEKIDTLFSNIFNQYPNSLNEENFAILGNTLLSF